jgi:polysaccharide export outer membrane protein
VSYDGRRGEGIFGLERRGWRLRAGTLGAALALAAIGCASTTLAPPPVAGSIETYRVGAPDELVVSILPEPANAQQVVVRPDGMISIDLIGDVTAAGRTTEEIAADIEQRIGRYKRDAVVTVGVLSAESTAITVLGEVKTQQSFPLQKETRVAEAIGKVGGLSAWGFAAAGDVRVIRSIGGETAIYNVDLDAIQAGDMRTNIELVRGDIVFVPSTPWAKVGYVIQAMLFPFQPFLGIATAAAGSYIAP